MLLAAPAVWAQHAAGQMQGLVHGDLVPLPGQVSGAGQAGGAGADDRNLVALGYTKEQAVDEAQRCLNCKNMPCVSGCPVKIHIPEFTEGPEPMTATLWPLEAGFTGFSVELALCQSATNDGAGGL